MGTKQDLLGRLAYERDRYERKAEAVQSWEVTVENVDGVIELVSRCYRRSDLIADLYDDVAEFDTPITYWSYPEFNRVIVHTPDGVEELKRHEIAYVDNW